MAANHEQKKASYQRKRLAMTNCGPLPKRSRQQQRKYELYKCDPVAFLHDAFPNSTGLKPLCDKQIETVEMFAEAMRAGGGRRAAALVRGFAKTSIATNLGFWASAYGYRRYTLIVSNATKKASKIITGLKRELQTSDTLYKLFPEILHPIWHIDGNAQRCGSQHLAGKPTHMSLSGSFIQFATIEGSPASGSCIESVPLSAALGLQQRLPDGTILRPDCLILDDVATGKDAKNPQACRDIITTVKEDLLMGGSHSNKQCALYCGTVRRPWDVTSYFVKQWRSVITGFFAEQPEVEHDLWRQYRKIRDGFDRSDPQGEEEAVRESMELYKANRAQMDKGYVPTWEWAFDWEGRSELSAVQHYHNLLVEIDDEEIARSELDNVARKPRTEIQLLSAEEIAAKQHAEPHQVVPGWAHTLSVGVDVQQEALYWCVSAFGDRFVSAVVDYGCWPEQPSRHTSYSRIERKMSEEFPHAGVEGRIFNGLTALIEQLAATRYAKRDGTKVEISLCLIDRGHKTSVIDQFCDQTPYRCIPAAGEGITAKKMPMASWRLPDGCKAGHHWVLRPTRNGSQTQYIQHDVNFWKTKLIIDGFQASFGDPGCVSLYHDHDEHHHDTFAANMKSETPTLTYGRGRSLHEWVHIPGQDNHLFDAMLLTMVAASYEGVEIDHQPAPITNEEPTITYELIDF